MRGETRVKRDVDVTAEDMAKYHIVVWGDVESNQLLARLMKSKLPVGWDKSSVRIGSESWSSDKHVPVAIMPNPESTNRYLVINSGLSFAMRTTKRIHYRIRSCPIGPSSTSVHLAAHLPLARSRPLGFSMISGDLTKMSKEGFF